MSAIAKVIALYLMKIKGGRSATCRAKTHDMHLSLISSFP